MIFSVWVPGDANFISKETPEICQVEQSQQKDSSLDLQGFWGSLQWLVIISTNTQDVAHVYNINIDLSNEMLSLNVHAEAE